jgi:hypothetical protein
MILNTQFDIDLLGLRSISIIIIARAEDLIIVIKTSQANPMQCNSEMIAFTIRMTDNLFLPVNPVQEWSWNILCRLSRKV